MKIERACDGFNLSVMIQDGEGRQREAKRVKMPAVSVPALDDECYHCVLQTRTSAMNKQPCVKT